MAQDLKIAIFGLNITDLNQLKTQISICQSTNILFKIVNITENDIDILLVTNNFINSVGIQKIIKEKVKRYLILTKSNNALGQIIDDQLFYPFSDVKYLREWLSQEILTDIEPINHKLNDKPFYLEEKKDSLVTLKPNTTIKEVFTEIFTPRNGYIQLFDVNGFIALIDTRTERVWGEDNITDLKFSKSLNQTYATSQTVRKQIEGKQIYDLRVWLWLILSRSTHIDLPKVSLNQNFKLEIWPQFNNDMYRRDYLKMAACFSEGANIESVKQHLNSTDEKIMNFISCMSLLQLGRIIALDEVKFSTERNIIDPGQTNKIRSFFGKLRKKLGL